MTKRITKTKAIEVIEQALEKQIKLLDQLSPGRDNPMTNEIYIRTCGKAEAFIDVLDVLKLNSLVTITI